MLHPYATTLHWCSFRHRSDVRGELHSSTFRRYYELLVTHRTSLHGSAQEDHES
jgi:hypothetical protein